MAQRTDEEKKILEQRGAERNRWKTNIEGSSRRTDTTTTSSGGVSEVTETREPSRSTSTQYTSIPNHVRIEAERVGDKERVARGLVKDENGEWMLKNPNIDDLFDMRRVNEEVEKVNRKKALNSALHQTMSTLGDMFTASLGGNVSQRAKDDIASKAAADTQARRDALIAAEAKAKEADRTRLQQALVDSQKTVNDINKTFAAKHTEQSTTGGRANRTTSTQPSTTTQDATVSTSPDAVDTTPMTVYSADGTSSVLNVDTNAVQSYLNEVALYLATNASALGLTNVVTGEVDMNKVNQMITDGSYYQHISDELKQKNRMLWNKSLEANTSNLSDEDYLNERHKRIYGSDRGATATSGSQDGRPMSAMQYLGTWYRGLNMPYNSARNSSVDEARQSGRFGSMLND